MPSTFPLLFAQAAQEGSNAAIISFAIYTAAVFAVAAASNRMMKSKSFLSEYFLGSRGLGVWAFALTFAATSSSGGSFMGFPSKVYTHGWSLALWIGSYMLVPVVAMGLIGKRLNQVARKADAITIPDVLRDRFDSGKFGTLATLLIVFFMVFNLVAQFKAGSKILTTLLDDVPVFVSARNMVSSVIEGQPFVGNIEPGYLLCLMSFAIAVIIYTSYGGFRAVVWTDVLQGIVMVVGVLILLPLALSQVGGLEKATDAMAKMTPPRFCTAYLQIAAPPDKELSLPHGTWVVEPAQGDQPQGVYRLASRSIVVFPAGQTQAHFVDDSGKQQQKIPVLQITTPDEIAKIGKKIEQGIQSQAFSTPVMVEILETEDYAHGADQPGVYLTGPGPSAKDPSGFLPLSLAVSFFFMWTFSGAGQPSNMVRLMAFNSARTLRRSIFTVALYYSAIYFPLVIIFCCARVLLPGMEVDPDRIMPEIAETLTTAAGWPWLAGLLVAAPFAAVMSTVDSFLLMISSAVVRDVYQRDINPNASEKTIKRLTYTVTVVVGVAALLGALNPPEYLQDIIVYTGSGLSASFLMPVLFMLYWSRFNSSGAFFGMLAGFLTHLSLYGAGFFVYGGFQAYRIFNFDPLLPAMLMSLLVSVTIALATSPPPEHLVKKYFEK